MGIAGGALIIAGLLFALLGMVGLFRFRHFYYRVLVTSNIDSAGMLLFGVGVALLSPDGAFALKVVIIAVLALITTPLSTHAILRSARDTGYRIKQEEAHDKQP